MEQGISNVEGRYSTDPDNPEKVSAKRFHTSTFCGSLFDILRFAFSGSHAPTWECINRVI